MKAFILKHQYSLRNFIVFKQIYQFNKHQQSHGIQQTISTRINLIGYDVNDQLSQCLFKTRVSLQAGQRSGLAAEQHPASC